MKPTKQFIEDAIEGGWLAFGVEKYTETHDTKNYMRSLMFDEYEANPAETALLDPLAWQAVGKTRGRDGRLGENTTYTREITYGDGSKHQVEVTRRPKPTKFNWRKNWHTFIDHLAEGKTIEEALQAIE